MNINTYPNPWDLRYFQELAFTENVSRAAERLAISQSALSLSLKRLEEQLQVQLFSRRNRGLVLNPAGRRLLGECNRLLNDWEAVVSETRKSQNEIKGRYNLGCHPSVALYTLSPLLREIYREHTGIEIQLTHGLSRVITEQVISHQVDFGIVVNPVKHPDLVLLKLGSDEVSFWKTPECVPGVLIYNPQLVQSQSMLRKLKAKSFERSILSENLEVIAVLARSGAGVALLPARVVQTVTPELKKIPGMPGFRDEIYFIYRADMQKTGGAKCIIEAMKNMKI
ncbi:MAG: LysR family transcriptional regulator [Pseudobdellovibrionaceae bacterium]